MTLRVTKKALLAHGAAIARASPFAAASTLAHVTSRYPVASARARQSAALLSHQGLGLHPSHSRSFHSSSPRTKLRMAQIGSPAGAAAIDVSQFAQGGWKINEIEALSGHGRCLLSVSGRDAWRFLQGLVTKDVPSLYAPWIAHAGKGATFKSMPSTFDAFYCAFLNPEGKIVAPVFMYEQPNPYPGPDRHVLIDCHKGNADVLLAHLKRYKLGREVEIARLAVGNEVPVEDSWAVWAIWDDEGRPINVPNKDTLDPLLQEALPQIWRDPRSPSMGYRFIVAPEGNRSPNFGPSRSAMSVLALSTLIHGANPSSTLDHLVSATIAHYTEHRIRQGVPEGPLEISEYTCGPFEANLDLSSAVTPNRVGYLGQKKSSTKECPGKRRILPVRIKSAAHRLYTNASRAQIPLPAIGAEIRFIPAQGRRIASRRKEAGKLLAVVPVTLNGETARGCVRGATYPVCTDFIGLAALRLDTVPGLPTPTRAAEAGDDAVAEPATALPSLSGIMELLTWSRDSGGTVRKHKYEVEALWPEWWPESAIPSRTEKKRGRPKKVCE